MGILGSLFKTALGSDVSLAGVPDRTHFTITARVSPSFEYVAGQLARFREGLLDLEPLWGLVEPIMADVEANQFEGAGGWPPLADSTILEKEAGGWPADPLVRTGDLKASLVDPGRAFEHGPRSAVWGSDVAYSGFHQDGTRRMPARQVIPDPFRVEDRRRLEGAMVTYINGLAAGTMGRVRPGAGPSSGWTWRIPVNLEPYKDLYREQQMELTVARIFVERGL